MRNWSRREFIGAVGVAAVASSWSLKGAAAENWKPYTQTIVIDACGAVGRDGNNDDDLSLNVAELADARDSGISVLNLTVSGVGSYTNDFETTLKNIAHWRAQIAAHPDLLMLWTRAAHTREARASNRLAVSFAFQDATPLGESLDRFDLFHELGVRIIQPTYNRRNLMGDGCLEPGNAGLSKLGRELVARMNERHVLLDLSHCGQRTTREGIDASTKPVAVTHSGCAAIADLPRNKRDDDLRHLAERGGVIGIYFMPYLRSKGQPMAADVIAHLEHAIKVCGEDHVGIGTDTALSPIELSDSYLAQFKAEIAERRRRGISAPGESEGVYTFVPDLNGARRLEKLAWLLSQRGHSDARIEKILGGNFARLFDEAIG